MTRLNHLLLTKKLNELVKDHFGQTYVMLVMVDQFL